MNKSYSYSIVIVLFQKIGFSLSCVTPQDRKQSTSQCFPSASGMTLFLLFERKKLFVW